MLRLQLNYKRDTKINAYDSMMDPSSGMQKLPGKTAIVILKS